MNTSDMIATTLRFYPEFSPNGGRNEENAKNLNKFSKSLSRDGKIPYNMPELKAQKAQKALCIKGFEDLVISIFLFFLSFFLNPFIFTFSQPLNQNPIWGKKGGMPKKTVEALQFSTAGLQLNQER